MKVLIGRTAMRIHEAIPEFRKEFPEYEFIECLDTTKYAEAIVDADVFVGSVTREDFVAAKKLKWIQASSTGVNNFMAIPELVASDVLLTNVRGTHGGPLSESVFGMIFHFTRGIGGSIPKQAAHEWAGRDLRPRLLELRGSTMGIIGFGSVGTEVARRAAAFDMRILALDMYPGVKPDHVAELWGMDRVDDLMAQSDYVVVAAPYTSRAHHMIGPKQIALMKPTSMMVIISRGGLADEDALIDALKKGEISAVAADVFEENVLAPDSPWWDAPNALVTPHIAGGSHLERDTILGIVEENLGRFLRGDLPLRNQIDMQKGF